MASDRLCEGLDCQAFGSLRCSQCKDVYYCSIKCQKSEWKKHKKLCKSYLVSGQVSDRTSCQQKGCDLLGTMRCSRCKHVSYCSKKCQTSHWKEHKKDCTPKNESTRTQVSKKCGEETCKKTGGLNCSRCKGMWYCSKDCQKKDWKRHKKGCGAGLSTNDGIVGGATNHSRLAKPNKASFHNKEDKDDMYEKFKNNPQFQNFFHHMMGMMCGENSSIAQEYLQCYPNEQEQARRIQMEESVYRSQVFIEKQKLNVFDESDFSSQENFIKRWGPCLMDADHLMKFLSDERKMGDIYERPSHYPFNNNFFQTMRNTSIANQVYEFDKTYVGFGFVDLFQILWGYYINSIPANSRLTFYGFEMNRVTTVRSKLIYGMMKHFKESEISTLSILQIWFSSCWDDATNQAFAMVLNDALENIGKYDLRIEDLELMKKWKKARVTIRFAQEDFSKGLQNALFDDVWRMKSVIDRVMFCRYLFTGCIFVDECNIVCGNPTMFTESNGQSKMIEELFFKAVDLLAVGFKRMITMSDSLFETITMLTHKTTLGFRSFINMGKIVCHLETKFVDPKDLQFASRIKSLQPYGIDWSNLPDYMEKKQFIKFARACSDEDTIHQLHFLNWPQYVFGACHVDWKNNQDECIKLHRGYSELRKKAMSEIAHLIPNEGISWQQFFKSEEYINPLNKVNIALTVMFREKFENYFLSDENGKILNRHKKNICDGVINNFFIQSPTMFRSAFTFNDDIIFQINPF